MSSATERNTMEMSVVYAATEFDYLRFSVSDIHGISRGKTISKRHIQRVLEDGGMGIFCGMYCFSTRAELDHTMPYLMQYDDRLGNAFMRPALEKVYPLPWAGGEGVRVGEVICETYWAGGEVQAVCPRALAKKQLDRLAEHGLSILAASEVEFNVFKGGDLDKPLFEGIDIFTHLRMSDLEELLFKMDTQLAAAGIDLEAMHTEYGPGQIECIMNPVAGIASADSHYRLKEAVKEIFKSQGYQATFMPRPSPTSANSGAHFNHSLWKTADGSNAFYDSTKADKLSDLARYWIAGVLKHARAITALCCPTFNCYRRVGEPWCPDKVNWGVDARTATIRAKNISPRATYVENRIPSSAANPYLVMAGTVAAGLDGVVNKLECPQELSDTEELIPRSLEEALAALEGDKVMQEALGEEFIQCFSQVKRHLEIEKFKKHDLKGSCGQELEAEREAYFEFL